MAVQRQAKPGVRRLFGAAGYLRHAAQLVWDTDRALSVWLAVLSVASGLFPVGVAYVGKLVIDHVMSVARGSAAARDVYVLLGLELILVASSLAAYRGLAVCEALLRVRLSQRVTELVLEKALALDVLDFDDPDIYDRLTRVREQAASRPLSLVRAALTAVQEGISLIGYAVLLAQFSFWLLLILVVAAAPAVLAEVRFAADAFRLFRSHTPETRRQDYLETLLSRDDHVREVRLFELGDFFLNRHRSIFQRLYGEDRRLTLKQGAWGFGLGAVGAIALAGSYGWVAWAAMERGISIGEMVMLFIVLRQSHALLALLVVAIGGMYEDNLYLSELHGLLNLPERAGRGTAKAGATPSDGLRLTNVSFTYPGRENPALREVSLHLPPGKTLVVVGKNGAGKSTLVKLATGLYQPTAGVVTVDGTALGDWDRQALRRRMAVLMQDFVRYQLLAGENIGLGDLEGIDQPERWQDAARAALVADEIEALPAGYQTQLGRWFADGQELSLGQWQRVALARAFMRRDADLIIFDEPTSKLDPQAEAAILRRLAELPETKAALLISHRIQAAQIADEVLVLEQGRVVQRGSREELLGVAGIYADLFGQAARDI